MDDWYEVECKTSFLNFLIFRLISAENMPELFRTKDVCTKLIFIHFFSLVFMIFYTNFGQKISENVVNGKVKDFKDLRLVFNIFLETLQSEVARIQLMRESHQCHKSKLFQYRKNSIILPYAKLTIDTDYSTRWNFFSSKFTCNLLELPMDIYTHR